MSKPRLLRLSWCGYSKTSFSLDAAAHAFLNAGANLDSSGSRSRTKLRPLQCAVKICSLDDEVAADLLICICIRPVVQLSLSLAQPYGRRGVILQQSVHRVDDAGMRHRINVGLPSRPVLPLSGFVAAPCLEVLFRFVRHTKVFHSFILRPTFTLLPICSQTNPQNN